MPEAQIDSTQPQILCIDDTPANLKILRAILEPLGYQVLVASNGKTALQIAQGTTADLILLDVVMPGMDGYTVCRKLREDEATKHIPVIFITIKEEKESVVAAFQSGGVDYIIKPFYEEEVLLRVQTHLEIARLTKDLLTKNRMLEQQAAELTKANEQLLLEITKRQQAEEALEAV